MQFENPCSSTTIQLNLPGTSGPNVNFNQPFYLKPAYRFKTVQPQRSEDLIQDGPGRRLRKNIANVRKHIDYIANVLNHIDCRLWQHSKRERYMLQPDLLYQQLVFPPASTPDSPVDCVLTKFVRSATNKVKCPIYTLCWTPEGKRLITGASSGEFTLWNGTAFNFETILQAHDVAVRALKWSHNDQWMASADHDGFVKYWQPNMNNVHMFQAHKDEPIRSLSFAPTDVKIVTGSDDATARIWDFARCAEERVLRGHGADVRSVDWHPTKGLIATGSRDSQQPVKLWDPKSGQCLTTLHDHKNSVMAVEWNRNGNWLLTGSRDHLIKLYDIRMMKEIQTFRGHKKEVTSLAWHPVHEGLFVSGGGDGSLGYWLVNADKELALLEQAHDQAVWTLEWHPLGHILATGSNDNNTKFWARNRPGDTQEDIFGLAAISSVNNAILSNVAPVNQTSGVEEAIGGNESLTLDAINVSNVSVIPGMGLDEEIYGEINRDVPAIPSLPGLGGGLFDDSMKGLIGAKKTLIKQPPPKKAQRQFERMWMISRPGGGNEFDDDEVDASEEGGFFNPPVPSANSGSLASNSHFVNPTSNTDGMRQSKLSLLGPRPPTSSILHQQPSPSLLSKPVAGGSHNAVSNATEWPTNAAPQGPPSLLSQRIIPPPPLMGNGPAPTSFQGLNNSNWRPRMRMDKHDGKDNKFLNYDYSNNSDQYNQRGGRGGPHRDQTGSSFNFFANNQNNLKTRDLNDDLMQKSSQDMNANGFMPRCNGRGGRGGFKRDKGNSNNGLPKRGRYDDNDYDGSSSWGGSSGFNPHW